MKDKLKNLMSPVVELHTQEKDKLNIGYPIVRDLCDYVAKSIKANLPNISDDQEIPQWWKNLDNLATTIKDEPNKMRSRVSEINGFLRGISVTVAQVNQIEEERNAASRLEEKVSQVADKIKDGELDLEKRRKVGERPESLKTLRMAQAKLSEEDN